MPQKNSDGPGLSRNPEVWISPSSNLDKFGNFLHQLLSTPNGARGNDDLIVRQERSAALDDANEFDRLLTRDREHELFESRALQLASAFIEEGDMQSPDDTPSGIALMEQGIDPVQDHVGRLEALLKHRREIALFLESLIHIYGGVDPLTVPVSKEDLEKALQSRFQSQAADQISPNWDVSLDEQVRQEKIAAMKEKTEHLIELIEDLYDYGTVLIRSERHVFNPTTDVNSPADLDIVITNATSILEVIANEINRLQSDINPRETNNPVLHVLGTTIKFDSETQFRGFTNAIVYLYVELVYIFDRISSIRQTNKRTSQSSDSKE